MSRLTRLLSGAALLLAPLLLASCGPKASEIRLKETSLKVYGLDRVVSVGGDVVDKKGEIVPGLNVAWESSDPKVATVDPQTGSVKTVSAGKATITARLGKPPLEARVALEVVDVASVHVSPQRMTLAGPAGTTFPLVLEAKASTGALLSMAADWTSSDPKVATVDASGVVTSVAEGKATVKAAIGDVSGATDVVVVLRPIESLEATPLNIPLKIGEALDVTLVARDALGAPIPDAAATWTSSDPSVATCSGGRVLGVGPGSATIRAVCGAKTAEVAVIVF
ncbi:MAG TPA: Ig-like domain-containing protein [Thermoanaerobaculia bacterium]|nr:Ig-like domain-containing protein [Thermoanaerobaculia bacterium]